jgi:hypothetical protein
MQRLNVRVPATRSSSPMHRPSLLLLMPKPSSSRTFVLWCPSSPMQCSQWRGLFLNTLGKYALVDHGNLDNAPTNDADWDTMECTVRSWMYAFIAPDLLNDVMMPDASPHHVWLTIEDQFFSNKETHALILDVEFRNFVQGDLPVSKYCRKLKSMVDSLDDLGEPILDRTLVLSVLQGLNEKFAYMGTILKCQKLFPSFAEVKNDLMVKEISMAKPVEPSHALITTALRPPTAGPVPSSPVPMQSPAPSAGPKKKNKNKKNSTTYWPSFYNPWTGLIQMWPGAPHGPLPGSCPPNPQ